MTSKMQTSIDSPSWLTPTVLEIAKALYERFDKTLLPILADALEEAGFQGEQELAHLRYPRHVPECCWVINAIVERERRRDDWARLVREGSS